MSVACQLSSLSQATSQQEDPTYYRHSETEADRGAILAQTLKITAAGAGDLANPALAVKAPAAVSLAPCSHGSRSHYNKVEKSSPTVLPRGREPAHLWTAAMSPIWRRGFLQLQSYYTWTSQFFSVWQGEFCHVAWNFGQTTEYNAEQTLRTWLCVIMLFISKALEKDKGYMVILWVVLWLVFTNLGSPVC